MSDEVAALAVKTLQALTIDVHQKREHDDTLPALAVVMSHPEESIPLLKEAYQNAGKLDTRINFARILAVLGDATGKETLSRQWRMQGLGRGVGLQQSAQESQLRSAKWTVSSSPSVSCVLPRCFRR